MLTVSDNAHSRAQSRALCKRHIPTMTAKMLYSIVFNKQRRHLGTLLESLSVAHIHI